MKKADYGYYKRKITERGLKMSKYKLIGLDMDGTLLNSKKKITPENMAAMEKAFDQGKEVVLSTGRSVAELREYTDIIKGLKYLVCISGAMVYDLEKEEIIYCAPIPNEVIDKVSEIAETSDVMVMLQTTEAIAKKTDLDNLEHFHFNVYKELLNSVATKVDNVFEYYRQKDEPVGKINIYHPTPEAREVTKKILSKYDLVFNYAEGNSLEVSPANVTKGTGLTWLCNHLGFGINKAIDVGDAENDMDAIATAGLGVAMANAIDKVKKIADVVLENDCDHSGCAEAIEKYLLG